MIYIINESKPQLVLARSTKKYTAQAIHTTRNEVLKFRDGYREVTVNEYQRIANGSYFPNCDCDAHRAHMYDHCVNIV